MPNYTKEQMDLLNHITALNTQAKKKEHSFTISTDLDYWASLNVTTVQEYEFMMMQSEVSDLSKEVYGTRIRTAQMDIQELEEYRNSLLDSIRAQKSRDDLLEKKRKQAIKQRNTEFYKGANAMAQAFANKVLHCRADPMQNEIETPEQLIAWFSSWSQASIPRKKSIVRGVYVTTQVRKEFLTSTYQGRIIVSGTSLTIEFINMGGGVYLAYIQELTNWLARDQGEKK